MLFQMLFRDEFIIMVERLDVHLFIWKQKGRYIKNSDSRSACALHILNCRHEYGNIDDTMTLLKINTPTLLLPYEQKCIQYFRHYNELIPKLHMNEHSHV